MVSVLNEYGISAYFWDAVASEKGYFGLLTTMKQLFDYCLEHDYERILVFEDDCKFVVTPEIFDAVMERAVKELEKINWDILYLGLQHVKPFNNFVSPTLLPVVCGYSTHACAYSKRAMKFFIEKHFDEPIDNFLVREFQPYNTCFATYPMLVTQMADHSDIAGEFIDWDIYITPMFEKNTRHLFARR